MALTTPLYFTFYIFYLNDTKLPSHSTTALSVMFRFFNSPSNIILPKCNEIVFIKLLTHSSMHPQAPFGQNFDFKIRDH